MEQAKMGLNVRKGETLPEPLLGVTTFVRAAGFLSVLEVSALVPLPSLEYTSSSLDSSTGECKWIDHVSTGASTSVQ